MVDKFYPVAPVVKVSVEIDKKIEAAGIIKKMEDGMSAEYALKCRPVADRIREANPGEKVVGDPYSKEDIIALQLNGRNCHKEISDIFDEVIADQKAMASVLPIDFKTETAYKTALGKITVYADVSKWCAGLKKEKGVTTWADLKAAFSSIEEIK